MPVFSADALPPFVLADRADALEPERLDDLGGVVGRAVVDDDDLEVGVVADAASERTARSIPTASL